jgi:hypothetical protein
MARKASLLLERGDLSATEPTFLNLVDIAASGTSKPRVLRVSLELVTGSGEGEGGEPIAPAAGGFLAAGAWYNPAIASSDSPAWLFRDHGVLEIKCGDGASEPVRTIYADIRSGEFQLPPCDFARVRVARYYAGDTPMGGDYRVSAQLVDGFAGDPSPLTFTAIRRFTIAGGDGGFSLLFPPQGAYAFELYPQSGRVFEANHGLQRNRLGAVQDPPNSPIPLAAQSLDLTCSVDDNNGDGAMDVTAVFFVR